MSTLSLDLSAGAFRLNDESSRGNRTEQLRILAPGAEVGHYKILKRLGSGGMGEVFLVEDSVLHRKVALKFLLQPFCQIPDAKERFIREGQAAAALNHPNIVTIHEVSVTSEPPYIAMEYIEGASLRDVMNQGMMPLTRVLDISIQVGEGLVEAHSRGIVHRDLKPENIIIGSSGRLRILDFGLAKVRGVEPITQAGTTFGTMAYMSPQQIQGEGVDHRCDIFSFGVIIYEMLTGVSPFRKETSAASVYAIVHEAPTPISSYRDDVPKRFQEIVSRALAKSTGNRYQSAENLLTDIKAFGAQVETRSMTRKSRADDQKNRLAVLPFANISPDGKDEYFADGITEELISTLSKIRGLKVIARTSVMRYKGSTKSVEEIGNDLKVGTILEGSVRKVGDKLRIVGQLVDVASEEHLWSEEYDRNFEDVFAIQSDIAHSIADALKIHLFGGEQIQIEKKATDNLEAYTLYLKGRSHWDKRTEVGLLRAIEYYREAISLDTSYAIAYTGLADAYILLSVYNYFPANEVMPKAKAAALKALDFDETLAEAHATNAHVKMLYDWDWQGAEKEFRRAFELNYSYALGHLWYAVVLCSMGRLDEAMTEINRALDLDPLSLIINTDVGLVHYFARRYEQAEEQYLKTLKLDPDFFVAHGALGMLYEQIGRYDEAIAEFQEALALSGGSTMTLATLGHAYAVAGRKEEAVKILGDLYEHSKQRYVASYCIARIYAGLDDANKVFEWLQKACEERTLFLIHAPLIVDPGFEKYRDDQRFIEILQEIGLKNE